MPGGSFDKPPNEASLHIGGIEINTLMGSRRSAEVKGVAPDEGIVRGAEIPSAAGAIVGRAP